MHRSGLAVLLVTQLIVVGMSLLSVAHFFGTWHRYVDLTTHFKPHYAFVSLLCLVIGIAFQVWPLALSALVVLALNLAIIVPLYLPSSPTRPGQPCLHLKIVCANVQYTIRLCRLSHLGSRRNAACRHCPRIQCRLAGASERAHHTVPACGHHAWPWRRGHGAVQPPTDRAY